MTQTTFAGVASGTSRGPVSVPSTPLLSWETGACFSWSVWELWPCRRDLQSDNISRSIAKKVKMLMRCQKLFVIMNGLRMWSHTMREIWFIGHPGQTQSGKSFEIERWQTFSKNECGRETSPSGRMGKLQAWGREGQDEGEKESKTPGTKARARGRGGGPWEPLSNWPYLTIHDGSVQCIVSGAPSSSFSFFTKKAPIPRCLAWHSPGVHILLGLPRRVSTLGQCCRLLFFFPSFLLSCLPLCSFDGAWHLYRDYYARGQPISARTWAGAGF